MAGRKEGYVKILVVLTIIGAAANALAWMFVYAATRRGKCAACGTELVLYDNRWRCPDEHCPNSDLYGDTQ